MSSRVACVACKCSFQSQKAMLQHCKDRHDHIQHSDPINKSKIPCPLCNRSFPSVPALQNHLCAAPAHQLDPLSAASAVSTHINQPPAPSVLDPNLYLQPHAGVACNDCGRSFTSTDFLHRHQWDSSDHTRVCKTRNPNFASPVRVCSQCQDKFASANDLEQHYVEQHPITEILKSDEEGTWQHIAERFQTAWKKPTIKLYEVHRIFKVYNPGWRRKDFEEWRKGIKQEMANQKLLKEEDDELRNKVLRNGNELRRYHGTTVKCQLGRQQEGTSTACSLCTQINCGMCRILQTGFKKSKCKVERFQRFGRAIYCSSISSKASAYVHCSSTSPGSSHTRSFLSYFLDFFSNSGIGNTDVKGNYKVMMACKVLAGRPYYSTHNMQHLERPPPGYHSVQGNPGVHLNYDELVVYDDRAILPEFIILYSSSD